MGSSGVRGGGDAVSERQEHLLSRRWAFDPVPDGGPHSLVISWVTSVFLCQRWWGLGWGLPSERPSHVEKPRTFGRTPHPRGRRGGAGARVNAGQAYVTKPA